MGRSTCRPRQMVPEFPELTGQNFRNPQPCGFHSSVSSSLLPPWQWTPFDTGDRVRSPFVGRISKRKPVSSTKCKKNRFRKPWLYFLEVPHSSARGFLADFRCRSHCGAFAVGFTLDDELVRAVAEAIQSALPQHGGIKDGHP